MPSKEHEDIRAFLNKYDEYADFSNYVNSLLKVLSDKSTALLNDPHYELLLSENDKASVINNKDSDARTPVIVPVKVLPSVVSDIPGNLK